MSLPLPAWVSGYRREWLRFDLVAGAVIWGVVTPQALAYAQIAGLPPSAGLAAAPVAMIAFALIGTSRQLVVSATTATSAISAATIGPMAGGDPARYAALSAALALVAGLVLVGGGLLRFGAVSDLVSTPIMTGFLFGLGLTIVAAQLPDLLGVPGGSGDFFPRMRDLLAELDRVDTATAAVGVGSVIVLLVMARLRPAVPWTLVVLGAAIAVSALVGLESHGVAVVGSIPDALPDPQLPDVGGADLVDLLAPALGVLVLSAEAVGVARSVAAEHHYETDTNRDLVGMGASNLAAGLASGFVQSGGASQTAAADLSGARSQLATLVSAGLLLLTGAFLAPLFADLPNATLAAIVIVAVSGFFKVGELRRFARIRGSALLFALLALAGVLAIGVLQGLVITAGLSLAYVVQRLSRPAVAALARDPATGGWGRADRHQEWEVPAGALVVGLGGTLLYPNAYSVRQHVLALAAERPSAVLVLDMARSPDLDVQSADMLAGLRDALAERGVELRLARATRPSLEVLERAGVTPGVRTGPTIDSMAGTESSGSG